MDDRTGRPSRQVAGSTAIQSLATIPTVQKYMDRFIDSQYGSLLPTIADNPMLKQRAMKIPYAKTVIDTVMDRLGEKRFDFHRGQALGQAGAVTEQLTDKYEQLSHKAGGEYMARRAMGIRARFMPGKRFDPHDLLNEARREARYSQGRELSKQEERAVFDAAKDIQKRAFDTKGLHTVYSRKRGGLAAQRTRTGVGVSGPVQPERPWGKLRKKCRKSLICPDLQEEPPGED